MKYFYRKAVMAFNTIGMAGRKGTVFRNYPILAALYLFLHLQLTCFSQCAVAPIFPGCAPSGSVPLVDGSVINTGATMTFSGSATYSNVTVNGGTLIVCGNLALTNFTVNSGVIYVDAGATLNYNGGGALVMNGSTSYYNSGTSLFSGHVILNSNVTVINDWFFSSPFNYIIIQGTNSLIVNNYQMNSGGYMNLAPSAAGCLCLGGNSWMTTNYFFNRITNGVVVPSGAACLNVRQYVSNDNSVTPNAGLSVCIASGVTYNGVPNWGSATINNNCGGCTVTLPIHLLSFDGHAENNSVVLNWSTLSETNNCRFIIERSEDAINFNAVGTLNGAVNSNSPLSYQFVDNTVLPAQLYYYQLRQEDCDGKYLYSDVIAVYSLSGYDNLSFLSSESEGNVFHLLNTNSISEISVYGSSGQKIETSRRQDRIDLSHLAAGIFFVRIITTQGELKTYKIQTM